MEYGKIQAQNQQISGANKQADHYDQHRQAILEWHESCKEFAQASQRRDQARAVLEKQTQILAEQIQAASYDPTCPQPTPPQPSNGQIGMAGQLRQY